MRAGTVTLRIDDLLVSIGADSHDAVTRLRTTFASWIDDRQGDLTAAFDLVAASTVERGVRQVPQLRRGTSVLARSRSVDHIVAALDSVLGGVRAHRANDTSTWIFLRPFISAGQVVLVDAPSPMLVNDPVLARAGIVEVSTWAVEVVESEANHGDVDVVVPSALTSSLDEVHSTLVGIVTVGALDDKDGRGALLARYGARHTSPGWFRTIARLLAQDRVVSVPDRASARGAITELLSADSNPTSRPT